MLQIDLESVRKCLEEDDKNGQNHHPEVLNLEKKLRKEFPKWMVYLSQGFNVLLQGCGSKRLLLDDFTQKELKEPNYSHMVISGYKMDVSIRQILLNLAENLNLDLKYTTNSVETARNLRERLKEAQFTEDLTLVIHSLDGPNFRDETTQNAFSILATIPGFHVIASVDHVNAFCLWDDVKLTRFRWIHQDATTYRAYSRELMAGESQILGLSSKSACKQHSVASLDSVWAALSGNSRQIFVELVRYAFENRLNKKSLGSVTFWQLYQISRGEFLVSSEAGLSHVMVEFQDHHVVTKKKASDGSEAFALVVEPAILKEFLIGNGNGDIFDGELEG